ncbi:6406_t:CDS:1 [Paraglomus occultum]|uniref:6406_t:CDS:1 n=1 Tax=Paraglomus occultum TaxID=144539 RepID=A0A9N8VW76_9GLOM|nr:6406_t:CDS:1 [Paraglomus occultum]
MIPNTPTLLPKSTHLYQSMPVAMTKMNSCYVDESVSVEINTNGRTTSKVVRQSIKQQEVDEMWLAEMFEGTCFKIMVKVNWRGPKAGLGNLFGKSLGFSLRQI